MKSNEIKNQLKQLNIELVTKAIDLTFKSTKKIEPFELSNGFTANAYGAGYIVGIYDGEEQDFTIDKLSNEDLLELVSQLEEDDVEETEFRIPVKWESFGIVSIKANSLKDAIDIFKRTKETIPLPEPEYVEDTFKADDFESMINHNSDFILTKYGYHSVRIKEGEFILSDGVRTKSIPLNKFRPIVIADMHEEKLITFVESLLTYYA